MLKIFEAKSINNNFFKGLLKNKPINLFNQKLNFNLCSNQEVNFLENNNINKNLLYSKIPIINRTALRKYFTNTSPNNNPNDNNNKFKYAIIILLILCGYATKNPVLMLGAIAWFVFM